MKAHLKPALHYFTIVFVAGFTLGAIRILWLVPRVGIRTAELIEMPMMIMGSILAARWIVQRYQVPYLAAARLAVGVPAFLLLLSAEFGVAIGIQGISVSEVIASRDPVSGPLYYISLVLFGLMPLLVSRHRGCLCHPGE